MRLDKRYILTLGILTLLALSGCMTGWDDKSYQEYRRISDKQNAQTKILQQEAFRRKQEAYYDSLLKKQSP